MDLFKITSSGLKEVEKISFDLERDIQSLVESNLSKLFNLKFVCTEFTAGEFRIDTLAFDEENSSFVIIEYKKGSSYSVVDQGYSYLSVMLANKADFILEYNERTGKPIKRDDVDWSMSRVIFISPSFNSYQKNSVNFKDVPFELWEIKKYSDDLIGFEQQKPTSKESIQKFEKTGSVISNVSSEVVVIDEKFHLEKCTPECINLWDGIKEYFSNLGDFEFVTQKGYIGIKKDSGVIAYVKFRRTHLQIDIIRGVSYTDGTKSKKFFNVDDPKKLCVEKEITWKSGAQQKTYSIPLNNKSQLEYVLWLLKQKYESAQS